MKKIEGEEDILDADALCDRYPDSWACLLDKGYQGLAESVRGIVPTKKKPGRYLNMEEKNRNREHASYRIIVENYFGRLCGVWNVLGSQFRWDENFMM